MGEDEVLNSKEAAEFLKVSRNTLMKFVQDGVIPAQKLGRQWRFSKESLLEWLKKGQVPKKEEEKEE